MKKYSRALREISTDLITWQKPLRILDAIKWDKETLDEVIKNNLSKMPKIDASYYQKRKLNYDLEVKRAEMKDLLSRIKRDLEGHPAAQILNRNCHDYLRALDMIEARGSKEFYKVSKEIYGSSSDFFNDGKTTLSQMAQTLESILENLNKANTIFDPQLMIDNVKTISSEEAVEILNKRLGGYFHDQEIKVLLDDGIVSDAAAGSDYMKLKTGAKFSKKDLDILEVHEGHVHIGTTLNGLNQPTAKWLSKGPPSTAAIQEGLAILMEVFSFVSSVDRISKINNRVLSCEMAEEGADFFDICHFYLDQGLSMEAAVTGAHRIFRGGLPKGGVPFTKDISYCKGFILIYNFLRSAVKSGNTRCVPFLFAGKLVLEDIPAILQMHDEGVIQFPKYVPNQFKDLGGISAWMAFSNFFNKMNLQVIESDYKKLFKVGA
jgi:uncharacterized protein (TIGR02421 family)